MPTDHPALNVDTLRQRTLAFIAGHHLPAQGVAAYTYSAQTSAPTLYASTYAAMARSLYNDLDSLTPTQRDEWVDHLNRHQDDDGLYRDPTIFGQGWYADDPLWCGRPHLSCHVVNAIACLGGTASKQFAFLDPWRDPDRMRKWLASCDWRERVAWTGNEIMNVGTLLQYARDFHNDSAAARAVDALLDWLSDNHIDPATGVWGDGDISDPIQRSHAVQAAYHWWPLFFYDRRPIPYPERAVDTLLATQNPLGGFGWGVHNPDAPNHSSACEDIDSIDPLARIATAAIPPRFRSSAGEDIDAIDPLSRINALADYRADEIRSALTRAATWVLRNQMADGGFVFVLGRPFVYGHEQLQSDADVGAMFPTWFRTLSLAILAKALPDHALGQYPWRFTRCPGFQFWQDD